MRSTRSLAESERRFILSLDEGTTSARALLFDRSSKIIGLDQCEFPQIYPRPGWVEHDPDELWGAQAKAFRGVLRGARVEPGEVAAIGIANQRETTILWDRSTGRPVHNAIVWQCRRTADMVEGLKQEHGDLFKERTGLVPDSYFSGPKIRWLLDHEPRLRERASRGEIAFGTVDSFLIFRLTGGRVHATDYTNASRTMLFNIHELEWDEELLETMDVPEQILPEPRASSEIYGYTDPGVFGASVPIAGDVGDQQAALFGQAAFEEGVTKCTYGTGNFLLMNAGRAPPRSRDLLTTIAWGLGGEVTYALEGSVFITGAAVQWLRDSLGIIDSPSEAESLASTLEDNEGVYFVPAFVGLGAPYWDQYARGMMIGLTRGTGRAHLARATLEAIAYLTKDVSEALEEESGIEIEEIRVDGGASRNDFLMQFQADVLGKRIVRPTILETTALGAAYMAGLAVDLWSSPEELAQLRRTDRIYEPGMEWAERERLYRDWRMAVDRSRDWAARASQ
jgi:glycerol kinase